MKRPECWKQILEHPRPQLRRERYQVLKEGWTLNRLPIHVPYPPQSGKSGYAGRIGKRMVYENCFTIEEKVFPRRMEKTYLRFGAVDQIAEVYLDDIYLGRHEGGYLSFSFEVSRILKRPGCSSKDPHVLRVVAEDSLSRVYPYGKQSKFPAGMFYTAVSGIWQRVWLETVPEKHVQRLILTPDLHGIHIRVQENRTGWRHGHTGFSVQITAVTCSSGGKEHGENVVLKDEREYHFENNFGYISLGQGPHLWTPETPWLYHLKISTDRDEVYTYAGLRTIESRAEGGVPRLFLNGQKIFLHGVLDQGYYPEGIFLPSSLKEYGRDILRMKRLGFNCLRKHVKIEPETFYYLCDTLGMLVIQDMVNNGNYHYLTSSLFSNLGILKKPDTWFRNLGRERKLFFVSQMKKTIRKLYNHPCVAVYTIFNEGWGQFESDRLYELAKRRDPTRLIDSTSGWYMQKKSDFYSRHIYYRNRILPSSAKPMLLSECGGYTLAAGKNEWKKTFGYGQCHSRKELTDKVLAMYREMVLPSIQKGLCGSILTQFSDVEGEINGLYTSDRKICKVSPEEMRKIAEEIREKL